MRSDVRKAIALAAAGATMVALGRMVERHTIARWASNPDALAGRHARFPRGEAIRVGTDDGAELNTVTAGEGPRVILIHGLTSCIDDLGPIAELLIADGFSVTGVDQRGHGGSTVGVDGFGAHRHAADLAAVLSELDVNGAVLVGHSMGGVASLTLAVENRADISARVSGLVAIAAPTSLAPRREQLLAKLAALPIPALLTARPGPSRIAAGWLAFGRDPSLFILDEALASFNRCPEATRREAMLGLTSYHLTDDLHRIELPVLVITGGADRLVSPANSGAVVRRVADARCIDYPGAGHAVTWERHQEIAVEIASFADAVQSS